MKIIRQPLSRRQPKLLAEQPLNFCGREVLYYPDGSVFRIALHVGAKDHKYIISLSDLDIKALEELLDEAKTKVL